MYIYVVLKKDQWAIIEWGNRMGSITYYVVTERKEIFLILKSVNKYLE